MKSMTGNEIRTRFLEFFKSRKPVGAYVKNLAGNGSSYWVYAFAFPIADGYCLAFFFPEV